MTIDELLNLLSPSGLAVRDKGKMEITSMSFNSRDMKKSSVFFAYKGENYDSNWDAAEIYESGRADFIIAERYLGENIPHAVVKDARAALSKAASAFFGNPLAFYKSVGVTGTNGKTTTAYLTESIFKAAGYKSVRIGTTGIDIAGENLSSENTTPSSFKVFEALRRGLDKGCNGLSIEISSHALAQGRLAGASFNAGVFTNLTGDHLDFHKDMESYFAAKSLLFTGAMSDNKIINVSDVYGKRLAEKAGEKVTTFSAEGEADIYPLDYESPVEGIQCLLSVFGRKVEVKSHLIGRYNLENIMGAFGAALALGISEEDALRGIAALENVPGRLEKYCSKGISVFVDYAHTDDALKNALTALRSIAPGRIITVFGAGGDRDKTKRPRMGKTAAELSDFVMITSDNPRTEKPGDIINDILAGISKNSQVKSVTEEDREKAIEKAIGEAREGDFILVAGKGHEDYQIIGREKHPFDDALIVKKYLERL